MVFGSALTRYLQVGDGLEMFVILASGLGDAGLQGREVTEHVNAGRERIIVLNRDLKRD